jgi:flagellar M-ring protein FliF
MSMTHHSPRTWGSLAACFLALASTAPAASATTVAVDPASAALQQRLDQLLTRVAGPGKAFVVVNATTNDNRATATSLHYSRRGVVLAAAGSTTRVQGAVSGTARTAGTDWGHGETVSSRIVAPGAIKRLDVALVLDRSISKASARKLAGAVATAAGLRRARGDRLTTLRTKLPPVTTKATASATSAWTAALRTHGPAALIALGALAFLAFVTREIRAALRPEPADA